MKDPVTGPNCRAPYASAASAFPPEFCNQFARQRISIQTKLVALEVKPFESVPERREVRLRIDARQARSGLVRELARLVRDFPGDAPVYLSLETSLGERTLALGAGYRVKPNADFLAEVKALLGETGLV